VSTHSPAALRLEHSRERIQRYLVRTGGGEQQQQRQTQRRRNTWVAVAVVGMVVGVLVWQKPWRRATGLASAVALLVAVLKAPGMLNTFAGRLDTLARWWHTVNQALKAGEDAPDPADHTTAAAPGAIAQPAAPAH
jgi:hypothetical protein